MELNKRNIRIILGIITFAVGLFAISQNLPAVGSFLSALITIFAPVIVGLCLAFILNIPMNIMEKKVFKFMGKSKKKIVNRLLRPVSLIATIILLTGFIILLLFIIIPQLKNSIELIIERVPIYYEGFVGWVDDMVLRFELDINTDVLHNPKFSMESIVAMAEKFLTLEHTNNIVNTAAGVTSSLISGVVNLALGFVVAVYVLAEKDKIGSFTKRLMKAMLPEKAFLGITKVCSVTSGSFSNFITGQFTDAFILAVLCFIGMSIFRFPNAAVISVIIGITALIPVIGPLIGEFIGCFIIFMESPLKALFFLIFVLVLQAVDNNFIYPKIVGKSVGIPGILVLLSVIVGGNIGGILGVLLGVPVASAVYALTTEWISAKNSQKSVAVTDDNKVE